MKRGRRLLMLLGLLLLPQSRDARAEHSPWFGRPTSISRTALKRPLPNTVRVRIYHSHRAIRIGCTGRYDYMSLEGGAVSSADHDQKAVAVRGAVVVGGKRFARDVLVAPVRSSDFIRINGRRFRGAVILESLKGGILDVIEQLPLEEYLFGVLPREVGGDWPAESLKAQAVVSRSYVLTNLATDSAQRFDVANDVSDQVYGGLEDEVQAANDAVLATRGQVLVNRDGVPVSTFFHSSCGGQTETPQYVWKKAVDNNDFESVDDNFCREDPFYHWSLDFSANSIKARLRHVGIRVGDIRKIRIDRKSPSGRAWIISVVGSAGSEKVNGNRFRLALGPERLRSTFLTEVFKTRKGFHFEGRGWGHGVGVCQWGARGRAKAGQTYLEILQAYYPKTSLAEPPPNE